MKNFKFFYKTEFKHKFYIKASSWDLQNLFSLLQNGKVQSIKKSTWHVRAKISFFFQIVSGNFHFSTLSSQAWFLLSSESFSVYIKQKLFHWRLSVYIFTFMKTNFPKRFINIVSTFYCVKISVFAESGFNLSEWFFNWFSFHLAQFSFCILPHILLILLLVEIPYV